MGNWKTQIDDLLIPYPEKFHLKGEIEEHCLHAPSDEKDFFDQEALDEFLSIHNSKITLLLRKMPRNLRNAIEFSFIGGPLMALLSFLTKERFMFQFFREGGAPMLAILVIGGFMFLREALLFMRVAILRDHTKINLRLDSSSVLIGAGALIVLGIGGTCLGAYVSVASSVANNMPNLVLIGLKESITNMIVSASFVALILMLHYTSRRLLVRWHAPISE
jgi:hypothetical protein